MKLSFKNLRLLALLSCLTAVLGLVCAEEPSTDGKKTANDSPATEAAATAQEQAAPGADSAAAKASNSATASEPAEQPAATEQENTDNPEKSGSELRSLTPSASITIEIPAPAEEKAKPAPEKRTKKHATRVDSDENIPFGHIEVGVNTNAREAVSILGGTTIKGSVDKDAVAIFGNNTIADTGSVGHDAVAVFGNLSVDGTVGHDTVAVFGNIHFGPKAVASGETVVVFGTVEKDEGAQTGPIKQVMSFGSLPNFGNMGGWASDCLFKGRLLSFNTSSSWAWGIAALHLFFYALLALLLGKPMTRCVETLETRPGMSLLSTFLVFLLTPLVIILLAIGTITAVLIPVLILGLFCTGIFGRAVMHAWFGRLITRLLPNGAALHIVVPVILGGVMISLLYCVPILGFLMHSIIGSIGLGAVILSIAERMKREPKQPKGPSSAATSLPPSIPVPPAAPVQPSTPVAPATPETQVPPVLGTPAVAATTGITAPSTTGSSFNLPLPVSPIVPPAPSFSPAPEPTPTRPSSAAPVAPSASSLPTSSLPRAGFWLRMGALGIDFVLVLLVCAFLTGLSEHAHMGPWIFIVLAGYGALLWKHRGTTIGGIICRIQVVRTDDSPLDWTTSIVRALGCILSAFAGGLGFIWIAIDRDQEAWHDKISGTAVVRVDKSRPLV